MQKSPKHKQRKPRYIALAAVSIDGRISLNQKKMPEWTSAEDWSFFQKELSTMDAVVAGRTTFEVAKAHMSKRRAFVLSSKYAKPVTRGTVTFLDPARTDLSALLFGYKKVGIVGGAEAYQTMLDLGLLDELYLSIEPIVFGRGRELFAGGTKNTYFTLRSVRKLNKEGALLLKYVLGKKI